MVDGDARVRDRVEYLIILLLVLATLVVSVRVAGHDFVNFDDDSYVSGNPHVQAGLTGENIIWAFTATDQCLWHPLVWVSYFLDRQVFRMGPMGFHLTAVFLHILNVVLLFLVFKRMTGSPWRSGFVAALFAVHPLHVESVAWVSQRKDVLSTLFWLLTMWAYVRYVEFKVQGSRFKVGAYLAVIVFFTLGLMSKPMLVTLPFVLLLLDYWPLCRVGAKHLQETPPNSKGLSANALPLLIEKIPLLVISLVFSVIACVAQGKGGAVSSLTNLPLGFRIANSLVSYVAYIGKMLWPRSLSAFYPHPGRGLPIWQAALALVLLAGASFLVMRIARTHRYVAVGWLWYLGTLVPVIGIIQIGAQGMADRYTYVPLIGLFIVLAWGIPDLVNGRMGEWESGRMGERESGRTCDPVRPFPHSPILSLIASVALVALAACAYVQTGYWRNSISLFERALAVTRNNYTAELNLGMALEVSNRVEEAVEHYTRALRINRQGQKAWNNMGVALERLGRNDDALEAYRKSIELSPEYAEPHGNLAMLLARAGRFEEAEALASELLRLRPTDFRAHNLMGKILSDLGKVRQAESEFREAIRLEPGFPDSHLQLALLLKSQNRFEDAIPEFRETIRLDPGHAGAHIELAIALYLAGDYPGAWQEVYECRRLGIELHPELIQRLSERMLEPSR